MDELDTRPDATGILPDATASTEPFAKNRTRCNQPAIMFLHPSGKRMNLTGCTHANGDKAGQKACGDSQPGTFRDIVHAADDLNAVSGPSRKALQQNGQGLSRPFDPRRDDAAGDYTRLEQAQVVAGKVEDLDNGRNIGGSVQINAGQANDRLVDYAAHASTGGLGWVKRLPVTRTARSMETLMTCALSG